MVIGGFEKGVEIKSPEGGGGVKLMGTDKLAEHQAQTYRKSNSFFKLIVNI